MTVTTDLLDKYSLRTSLRRPSLALVIERADDEEDIENMIFTLGGFYTKYVCDECGGPMIREFKDYDYYSSADPEESDIYRCTAGHRFQVGGKWFSGMRRIADAE